MLSPLSQTWSLSPPPFYSSFNSIAKSLTTMNYFYGLLVSDFGLKPKGEYDPMAPPSKSSSNHPNSNSLNFNFRFGSTFKSDYVSESSTNCDADNFDDLLIAKGHMKKWWRGRWCHRREEEYSSQKGMHWWGRDGYHIICIMDTTHWHPDMIVVQRVLKFGTIIASNIYVLNREYIIAFHIVFLSSLVRETVKVKRIHQLILIFT